MRILLNRFFRYPIAVKSYYRSDLSTSISPGTMASASIAPQKFDYLLILDFEATCDNGIRQPCPQEIIEFPCLKMRTIDWTIESQFHQYVRPTANPQLTTFCTELTGIVQDMVDNQPNLQETLKSFHRWLIAEKLIDREKSISGSGDRSESIDREKSIIDSNWAFVTCGDWDLKTMLKKQCDHFGYERPDYFRRWINIKKSFFQETKVFPKGMMEMLQALNLRHEGRHHSGIDDTKNIAQLVKCLGLRGYKYDVTGTDIEK